MSCNQLKEKICSLNVHRKIADLVNDEHFVLGQNFELVGQSVFTMGFFQLLNELVAVGIIGGKPVLHGHKAQSRSQVGFAHTGQAKEDHIFSILQETHGSQLIDLTFVNRGLERKIEVIQYLLDGEPGHLNLLLVDSLPFGFCFF